MRPTRVLLAICAVLAQATAAGCGSSGGGSTASSGSEATATAPTPAAPAGARARACEGTVAGTTQVRVTGVGCDVGRGVVAAWAGKPACAKPAAGSRFACSVHRSYRCLGAATGQGVAVSCSRPGSSVAFIARQG